MSTTDTPAAIDFPIAALAEYFTRAETLGGMIARAEMVQDMATAFLQARRLEEAGDTTHAESLREAWYALHA